MTFLMALYHIQFLIESYRAWQCQLSLAPLQLTKKTSLSKQSLPNLPLHFPVPSFTLSTAVRGRVYDSVGARLVTKARASENAFIKIHVQYAVC